MGLDIYFEKRRKDADCDAFKAVAEKRGAIYSLPEEEFKKPENQEELQILDKQFEELDPRKQIAYFRKVNFLVAFFNYEEDCSYLEISKEQVEDLIERCKTILRARKNKEERAKELLPTESGFFFGSTEYDDWYYEDVKDVRKKFTEILETTDWDEEIVEMYCWW